MIEWTDLDLTVDGDGNLHSTETAFSHVDNETGEVRHFAVTRIEKWLRTATQVPIIRVPIDMPFARYCMVHRGVEKHRYDRITKRQIMANPVIVARIPGVGKDAELEEHLIIDGAHRYCKAAHHFRMNSVLGYELQPYQWEPFLIRVPDAIDERTARELRHQDVNPIDSRIR